MPATARRLRPVFWALLAALALDLSRAAFVEPHWDEDACLSIGWLLSRGWKLYRDVFTHHLPLDYLPSWLVACATGGSFTAARVFMLLLWAAFCALAYELWTRRRGERLAPFLLLVLSSQWLTYWYGEMMLVENLWAYAAALGLLLLEGPPPERRDALALGACLGVLASASLVCAAPLACFAVWLALDRGWRAQARWVLAGAAAWLLPFGAWAALHADLPLLWQQAVRFNLEVYPRFFGYSSAVGGFWRAALVDDLRYFGTAVVWNSLEHYFEGLLKLAVLAWVSAPLLQRGRRPLALWRAAFVIALRSRPERMPGAVPFHAAPFFVLATVAAADLLSAGWRRVARSPVRAARWGAAVAAAVVLAPTLAATSQATLSLRRFASPSAAAEAVSAALSSCVPPRERILVMPMCPRLYLESRREPAAPAVFYFPWQAAWPPQHEAFLAALRARQAAVIVVQEQTDVWSSRWNDYAADLQREINDGYVLVSRGAAGADAPAFAVYARRGEERAFVACAGRFSTAPTAPR